MRVAVLFGFVALAASAPLAAADFDAGKASFSVTVRDATVPYRVLAVTLLPGAELPVHAPAAGHAAGPFTAEAAAGSLRETAPGHWRYRAPDEPGIYPLTIHGTGTGETIRLNVLVLIPRSRVVDGRLNGYRIDAYPTTPLKGLEVYKPPRGFIEVTEANADTAVSPHFKLGQFVCKQDGGYPKYIVLRERLLLKLELLLEQVNGAGFRADTFHVMSGYRTPFYNREIGNVKYSRHVYGGAADIFIDEHPRDGVMDDLNGDGTIDVLDAGVLYDLIDKLYGTAFYEPYVGGLGRYKTTSAHGPFVHVDVRGFRARWGD